MGKQVDIVAREANEVRKEEEENVLKNRIPETLMQENFAGRIVTTRKETVAEKEEAGEGKVVALTATIRRATAEEKEGTVLGKIRDVEGSFVGNCGREKGGSSGNRGSGKDFVVDDLSRVIFWAFIDRLSSGKAISKIWTLGGGVGFLKNIQSTKLDDNFYGREKEHQLGKEARAGNWTGIVDNIGFFMCKPISSSRAVGILICKPILTHALANSTSATSIPISLFEVQSGATNDFWKPHWIEE